MTDQYDDENHTRPEHITPDAVGPLIAGYYHAVHTFLETGDTFELASFATRRFVFESDPDLIARAAGVDGGTRPPRRPK
jgi:hypothetical protein